MYIHKHNLPMSIMTHLPQLIKSVCSDSEIYCMQAVEQLARDVYNYFMSSPKRLSEVKEFQDFVKVKPHKLLHPSQTCWLSLQAVVCRVLEQYDALILYFTDAALSERIVAAEEILHCLKGPSNKLTIMDCYIRRDHLQNTPIQDVQYRNPSHFLPLDEIYLGGKVTADIAQNTHGLSLPNVEFLKRCLNFLVEKRLWQTIAEMKKGDGSQMFPQLSYFIYSVFGLPHSSAAAERIFSAIKNMKTKQRNSLSTKTLVALLHSRRYLKEDFCFSFPVSNALLQRMTSDMYYDSE
ncbi:uncharacterized protein LOC119585345 [Penaeus monodon]|uniref:uncharacterized protein LOC119585345 n=1 Tax=Penaeus monodon TaxID=6687 RepID=UPI0018A72A96|nr:uncharacterized protein LOC119585345 [Penaeus monodon]